LEGLLTSKSEDRDIAFQTIWKDNSLSVRKGKVIVMDLFDYMRDNTMKKEAPLASRLRPVTLDEVVGQSHIIGKDKLLYRAIKADKISSIIFYGPPGTGKTTLAKVIANTTSSIFTQINATSAGKKDMEAVVEEAKDSLGRYGKRTILFIDEIHRFNKGQQDYLLPYVEDGTVILIGATTENPYFEVNSALLSRSIIFELKPLEKEDIKTLLGRAVYDRDRGMGAYEAVIEEEALEFLADISNGDARSALNAIEIGILTTERSEDGKIHITLPVASECIQKRVLKYDKDGDNHYDTISAFIKSMRGSDPDAAVYYLARMLYAGEEVAFIARRIMICAAEDVSNADPNALVVATSAALAVERLGMPEARIVLAQAAIYVACAPKSNSAICAIDEATSVVENEKTATIPAYLMDAHYKGAAKLGHGLGYQYAHNYENHYVRQQYLPDEIKDRVFYTPSDNGYEVQIQEYFKKIKGE
jgi:putative ATPase